MSSSSPTFPTLRRFAAIPIAALAIAVSGCASHLVVSRKVDVGTVSAGTTYSLPLQLVEIRLSPTPVLTPTDNDLTLALSSRKAADDIFNSKDDRVKTLEGILKLIPVPGDKTALEKELAAARTERAVADASRQHWDARLTEIRAQPAAAAVSSPQLSLRLLPMAPDPRRRYVADLNHRAFRSDKLTLNTTSQGLLSGAVGHSEDQSLGTLTAVLSTLAVARGPTMRSLAPRNRTCTTSVGATPLTTALTWTIDPTDAADLKSVNDRLDDYCLNVEAVLQVKANAQSPGFDEFTNLDVKYRKDTGNSSANSTPTSPQAYGLFYRRAEPYSVRLMETVGHSVLAQETVFLPNASPIAMVPFRTGGLTKSEFDVEFTEGMLTKMDVTRPSEALAAASLPLSVVSAVLGSVTDFVQLKIDLSKKNKDRVTEQTALIKALAELMAAKEAADKQADDASSQPD